MTENNEREIFVAALAIADDQREAYLEQACRGDQTVLQRVRSLLQASQTDDGLFDQPRLATTVDRGEHRIADDSGTVIDRYKLLERIGEGGMAVVYMAQQEQPVRRKVAVKIIKPGMDSANVIARFEAERQALARMDHPHIAKIFDGGSTEQGRPYFVMELVRGVPITEYCDQNRLSTNDRLELFIDVCHAVTHAHQKGIIHRDLKPSNILVTLADGRPVPKVIDFGIAKATRERLTDKTLFTRFHYFVGTPAYMSPEQAHLGTLDIDTRTDIYALGALLYELLSGRPPFDPQQLSSLEDVRRTILEQDPRPPSTRILTISSEDLQVTASRRHAEPGQLVRALKSDLDWITMKCLEKDRTRRYESADALAEDVKHYLAGETVVARPPSAVYRARKFMRRNKVAVVIASVLLVAAVLSTWQAIRATRAVGEQNRLRAAVETALEDEEQQRRRAESEQLGALRRAYSSDMTLAQLALQANNYGRVVGLLQRYDQSLGLRRLRNWEWRYFWNQTQSEAAFALPRQSDAIARLALSGDSRLLLTADLSGVVKLWDLDNRRPLLEIEPVDNNRSAFTFSHDGSKWANVSSSKDGRISIDLWTVAERKVVRSIEIASWPSDLAFTPDDSAIMLLGPDLSVERLTITSGKNTNLLGAKARRRWNQGYAAFSPDHSMLAALVDSRIHVWSLETGDLVGEFEGHGDQTWSLAFSHDGKFLAAGPSSSAVSTDIKLYAIGSGEEVGNLRGHVSWVPSLAFNASGTQLVSVGADQTLRIWNVAKGNERAIFHGHLSEIYRVVVSTDGKTIVSGAKDGSILVWDAHQYSRRARFETLPIPVSQIVFVPGTSELLALDTNGRVTLWDSDTLHPVDSIDALGSNARRLLVSADGNRVFASDRRGGAIVLDLPTRQIVTEIRTKSRSGFDPIIGLGDQDRSLVVRDDGSNVRVIDTRTWKTKKEIEISVDGSWMVKKNTLSPDAKQLATGGVRGPLRVVNLETGEVAALEEADPWGASDFAFSPAGDILAASSLEGVIRFWDASTLKLANILRGHLIGINAIAFSPDGSRFASASQGDEAVKLWDVATGLEVTTLPGEGFIGDGLTFSPDGNLLVAINSQNKALIWRAPPLEEIQRADDHSLDETRYRGELSEN